MSLDSFNPEPPKAEVKEVNPAAITALAHESIGKLSGLETQGEALDCVLDIKMQCLEQDLPFDEVQQEIVAGWKDTVKNVGFSIIMGTVKNPQGLTAVGQLLS